jgi:alpha-glucosidase
VATYYGNGDELHLSFNFPPLYARWEASKWRRCIEDTTSAFDPRDAWPTWVLSNHDNPRHRSRYDLGAAWSGEDEATRRRRSEARARAAAVLLLTLRGTPFLFQGEELGLIDAVIPPETQVDPGGRDGCRAPIPWDSAAGHGWPVGDGGSTWLPFPPESTVRNYSSQRDDSGSVLHLYRRLLRLRKAAPALALGTQVLFDPPEGVLAYCRAHGDDRWIVLVNFTDGAIDVDDIGAGSEHPTARALVEVASDGMGEGEPFSGRLLPDQAVVLRAGSSGRPTSGSDSSEIGAR